jgi:hypothetical protein
VDDLQSYFNIEVQNYTKDIYLPDNLSEKFNLFVQYVASLHTQAKLYIIPKYDYFCTLIANRPHSSMDRISDSGSDDLGSNPDGVTELFHNHL